MNEIFKNIQDHIEYPNEGILSKEIFKTDMMDVSLFNMAKGTEMSEHTSTKEGFVYVLEGKGTFNLEGKNIKMEKGVIIYMKKNAIHSLKSEENTCFILALCD